MARDGRRRGHAILVGWSEKASKIRGQGSWEKEYARYREWQQQKP